MRVLTILMLFCVSAVAGDFMSEQEQIDYVEKAAKEMRREMWINGYEDVSSSFHKPAKEFIDNYVATETMQSYENALDQDEISAIYSCFHRKNCSVFFIGIGSSYYSGYGEEGVFLLLNIETRRAETIRHVIYAE